MAVPEKLGKYEIKKEIDSGSMGTVYLGYDPYVNRNVAVKVAHAASLADKKTGQRFKDMFFNEAHTAGRLTHPNIISIYDAGIDGENCYIVMELVEKGNTLKDYCRPDNLLPVEKAISIIFKCAKALDYAHAAGVIHRDIKPSNILIKDDMDVQIADFSIAKIKKADAVEMQPSGFMGSPRYMSPEQLSQTQLSHQTDIFSLGVVMYEILTGIHPFSAGNFSKLVDKILHTEPDLLSKVRPELPKVLTEIFQKAVKKSTADRYQNGLEFALDLKKSFDILSGPEEFISQVERFNSIKGIEFFRGFLESELNEIVRSCTFKDYAMKENIIVEGDIDDCFYIIVEGQVGVVKQDQPIGVLDAGDCFGEMGYLTKAKRTASIKALTRTVLLKMSSTNITQLPLVCQVRFLKVFLRTLVRRLSITTSAEHTSINTP